MAKIIKTDDSFFEYIRELAQKDFHKDLAWASYLSYEVSRSTLNDKRKKQLLDYFIAKIKKRISDVDAHGLFMKWDERQYKKFRAIEKELKLKMEHL